MLDFPEGLERAAEHSRTALELIDRHSARRNPCNYAIWYTYASGVLPDLVKTLDILASNQAEYTEDLGRELFQRYLETPSSEFAGGQFGEKLSKQIHDVMKILEEAGSGTRGYGTALHSAASRLAGDDTIATVKEVIASLVAETQSMTDRTRALEVRLQTTASETQELRKALEVARRDAMIDGLTELANRKAFDIKLRESAMQVMETGEPLSLLMCDIDHFKKFNDSYGHQMGDQVLRLVSRTLSETLKGRDTPARYGGEEFAIILPSTAIGSAVVVAEQIRERVASRQLVRKGSKEKLGAITLSIGAAQFRMGEPLADLIERADTALYKAKSKGRNRVVIGDDTKLAAR